MRWLAFIVVLLAACSTGKPGKVAIEDGNPETVSVAVQPLGKYDKELADTLVQAIERYYGFTTYLLPQQSMQEHFFVHIKSPRYRADSIIHYLRQHTPDSINYVLGFTRHDISTTKRDEDGNIKQPESKYTDWGIFGLGFRPGPSCVVSTHRLGGKGRTREIDRVKKIALHELGHNLGLPHCPSENCFMRDAAETIKTIDAVTLNLCNNCKDDLGIEYP